MAEIVLKFTPPDEADITLLHVEEAPSPNGVWVEKATFNAGTYPTYIDHATVANAVSATDWFRIRWQNEFGAFSPYSAPFEGGTETYISELVERVRMRLPQVSENVVTQEAEVAIEEVFGVGTNPYASIDPASITFRMWAGLTYLTMARVMAAEMVRNIGAESVTIGLISMKSSSGQYQAKDIAAMIDLANRELGRGGSLILDMQDLFKNYGGNDWQTKYLHWDQEYRSIPWTIMGTR